MGEATIMGEGGKLLVATAEVNEIKIIADVQHVHARKRGVGEGRTNEE